MIGRLLVVAVLVTQCHHIEGVCRPFSPLTLSIFLQHGRSCTCERCSATTLALKEIKQRFIAQVSSRNPLEAIIRAWQKRLVAIERAELAAIARQELIERARDRQMADRERRAVAARRPAPALGQRPIVVDGEVLGTHTHRERR